MYNLLEKCYQISLFPSEPGDCRQTFLYTPSCTCLLVLSSGPEDHLAAVKQLQEEGRASAKVCALVCLCVCVCVCVDVHGAWLEQAVCGSSNAAFPYPVAKPSSDAGHTAPSAGLSCPAGRVSCVSILACMRIKALV